MYNFFLYLVSKLFFFLEVRKFAIKQYGSYSSSLIYPYLILVFFIMANIIIFKYLVPDDSLTAGQALLDGQTLVSAQGIFTLGFFPNGDNTYLGIWYNNMKPRTVVWVANRDAPIKGGNGSLTLSTNSLDLLDRRGNIVWSRSRFNTNSPQAFPSRLREPCHQRLCVIRASKSTMAKFCWALWHIVVWYDNWVWQIPYYPIHATQILEERFGPVYWELQHQARPQTTSSWTALVQRHYFAVQDRSMEWSGVQWPTLSEDNK